MHVVCCMPRIGKYFYHRLKHELKEKSYMTSFFSCVTCIIFMFYACENSKLSIAKINHDGASAQCLRIFTKLGAMIVICTTNIS